MSCGKNTSISEQVQIERGIFGMVPGGKDRVTIPEPKGAVATIATGIDKSSRMNLSRGSYIIRGYVENMEVASLIENEMRAIPVDGEFKRVFFHKIDVQPPEMKNGKIGSKFTQVITVIDNPIPLVPVVWAAAAVSSLTAGWFFVDKVETFTESSTGKFLSVAATVAGLAGLYFIIR